MILAPIVAALSSVLVSVGIPLIAAQAIVGIGLAAGMYALQRLLTPRQRPPGQEFEAKAGANVPMFCVYGRQRLAGVVMPPVQTGRRVLHVRVIGIDWHDAMEFIVIDGERCRFNGIDGQWSNAGNQFIGIGGSIITPDPGGDGTHLGDPPWTPGLQSAGADGSAWVTTKEYGNNVKVKFYDGRPVQNADATLVAQSGSDAQGNKFWTTDHKGGGVCYAIVDIEPDSNKNLSANPQIEFIVRGRRLWDPRKDTTYGGTGSHSRADKSTWEWSDNVALAVTDYRLGVFIGGVKMMGIGTPIARLRMDSRIAAANLCDTPRPLLDDAEEPMWRIAAVITNERTHRDNLQIFYDAMAGWETERGGTYRLTAGGPQTPVVAITDADLVKGPRRYKAKKPRSDRYNAVAGKFADPWNAFELQDLPLRTSSEDEAIDGGERLTMTLTLSQVPSQTQAQHLMEIARRRMRLQATATVAVPPRLRDAETMDTVTWASTYHGGAAREFHIQQWKKQRDLTLSWGLVETSADIWDWDPEVDQLDPLVAADLPSAAERLATVAGFAVAASYDVGEGGQKLPVFLCSWTPIADLTVDAVIVRYRPVGATDWSQQRFDTADTLAAGEGKISAGLQAETDYEFEADLATTPPRYTTVQTPAPVTSDPNHVVKKAIITDTVEPGGVDRLTLDPAFSDLWRRLLDHVSALELANDEQGARYQVLDAVTETESRKIVDRLERVSARMGNTRASVSTLQTAVANLDGAFAGYQVATNAAIDAISAEGVLEFAQAVSLPTGAASGARMLVKAVDTGHFAEAGIEAYAEAGGGGSPDGFTVLVGNRIYRRKSSETTIHLMVDEDGRFIRDGIAEGSATKVLTYKRDSSLSAFSPGTGSNSGTSGNGWADILLAEDIVLTRNTGGIIGETGSKVIVRGDMCLNANATNSNPGSSYGAIGDGVYSYWYEVWVRMIARPSAGGSDIEIAPPIKFRSTPVIDPGSGVVSQSMPELSNDYPAYSTTAIDAGTYDILAQHKIGRTGYAMGNTMNVKMRGVFTFEAKLL